MNLKKEKYDAKTQVPRMDLQNAGICRERSLLGKKGQMRMRIGCETCK